MITIGVNIIILSFYIRLFLKYKEWANLHIPMTFKLIKYSYIELFIIILVGKILNDSTARRYYKWFEASLFKYQYDPRFADGFESFLVKNYPATRLWVTEHLEYLNDFGKLIVLALLLWGLMAIGIGLSVTIGIITIWRIILLGLFIDLVRVFVMRTKAGEPLVKMPRASQNSDGAKPPNNNESSSNPYHNIQSGVTRRSVSEGDKEAIIL